MKNTRILTFASFTLFALPAVAVNPYAMEDNSWISINGEVTSVTADAFELDYGDGQITVEMDDGDRDADGYKLMMGDEVRVSGMIDDDFYDLTTIEASSVYVKNIDTYFYASAMDEEDIGYSIISPSVTDTVVQGTITSVDVNGEQFTLDSGFQQLDVGDRVSVQGSIDHDFFEGRVFEANYVTTLYSAS